MVFLPPISISRSEGESVTGMKVSAGTIKTFHGKMQGRAGDVLGTALRIRHIPEGRNWKRASRETIVAFELHSANDAGPFFARRRRGGNCPVVRISQASNELGSCAWASWHEEWRSRGQQSFGLLGASWTFFWGLPFQEDKQQLFRAEWDHVHFRRGTAAQPHWHFDREVIAIYEPSSAASASRIAGRDLEELPTVPSSRPLSEIGAGSPESIDLSSLHLGMAGWSHAATSPECWQLPIRNSTALLEWAIRTLEYTRSQVASLFPLT